MQLAPVMYYFVNSRVWEYSNIPSNLLCALRDSRSFLCPETESKHGSSAYRPRAWARRPRVLVFSKTFSASFPVCLLCKYCCFFCSTFWILVSANFQMNLQAKNRFILHVCNQSLPFTPPSPLQHMWSYCHHVQKWSYMCTQLVAVSWSYL